MRERRGRGTAGVKALLQREEACTSVFSVMWQFAVILTVFQWIPTPWFLAAAVQVAEPET